MLGKTNVKIKPNKKKVEFEILEFTSSILPTTWTEVTEGTEYTATNEYGEWKVWADNYSYYTASGAFDGDAETYWRSSNHSDSNTPFYIGIDLPSNVLISPKDIYIKSHGEGSSTNPPKLLGLNLIICPVSIFSYIPVLSWIIT